MDEIPQKAPSSADELRVAISRQESQIKRIKKEMIPDAIILLLSAVAFPFIETGKWMSVPGITSALFFVRLTNQYSHLSANNVELAALRAKLNVSTRLDEGATTSPSYFERLVKINLENLAAYYALVAAHTNKSFIAALVAGVLGFGLVAAGLIAGFVNSSPPSALTYISTGSGVLTEAVAGVLFYLYNRAVLQMKDYHNSLLEVQNVLLALKVANDLENETDRRKIMQKVLSQLFARPTNSARSPARGRKRPPQNEPSESTEETPDSV